jgi:hypothetical protein
MVRLLNAFYSIHGTNIWWLFCVLHIWISVAANFLPCQLVGWRKLLKFSQKKVAEIAVIALLSPILIRATSHEPRAVTMKLWEPKSKWPKAIPRHFQNHVVWSRILKCSVKSYVIRPSIECYFNECPIMQVLAHDKLNKSTVVNVRSVMVSWFALGLPPRGGFWK